MAETYKYVQADTGPQMRLSFTDEDTDTATDLTGASVYMHFRALGSTTLLWTKELYIDPVDASDGIALMDWLDGSGNSLIDVDPGIYEAEIEVVRSTGVRETIYDKLKFKIREDLGQGT